MSGVYAYDGSVAENVSSDLNGIMSAIESILSEMDGDMHSLGGSWEGEEQEQYQGVHQKWSGGANKARGVLAQVRASLDENSQSVAGTRQRVAGAIAGN